MRGVCAAKPAAMMHMVAWTLLFGCKLVVYWSKACRFDTMGFFFQLFYGLVGENGATFHLSDAVRMFSMQLWILQIKFWKIIIKASHSTGNFSWKRICRSEVWIFIMSPGLDGVLALPGVDVFQLHHPGCALLQFLPAVLKCCSLLQSPPAQNEPPNEWNRDRKGESSLLVRFTFSGRCGVSLFSCLKFLYFLWSLLYAGVFEDRHQLFTQTLQRKEDVMSRRSWAKCPVWKISWFCFLALSY